MKDVAQRSVATLAWIWIAGVLGTFESGLGEDAQPVIGIRSWGVEHGLPSMVIRDVTQSADGFLWLATGQGLARFDGMAFRVFDHTTTPELGGSDLTCVTVSAEGRLWCADRSGHLTVMEPDGFQALPTPFLAQGDYVTSLTTGKGGRLVGGTRRGLIFEIVGDQASVAWRPDQWFEPDREQSPGLQLVVDEAGARYAAFQGELFRSDEGSLGWILPDPTVDSSESVTWVSALATSPRGGVWVASNERMQRFQDGDWVEERGAIPWRFEEPRSCLLETRSGQLWAAAYSMGLKGFLADGSTVNVAPNDGLPAGGVLALFEDREGNLWVGTNGGGLARIRPALFQLLGGESYLGEVPINSVAEDETHDLWLATDGEGLLHWDGYRFRSIFGTDKPVVRVVLVDSLGRIWAGVKEGGLAVIIPENEARTQFRYEMVDRFDKQTVVSLCEEAGKFLWVATENGVDRLPLEDPHRKQPWLLPDWVTVQCLYSVAPNEVWLGTRDQGVLRWDSGEVRRYGAAQGLPDSHVTAMCLDPAQRLWVGTNGGGVACFDGDGFQPIGPQQGLSDGFVTGMINDQEGNLWLTTAKEIIRLEWEECERVLAEPSHRLNERSYGFDDGFADRRPRSGGFPNSVLSDLRLVYVPLTGGLLQVPIPSRDPAGRSTPPVVIVGVEIDGSDATLPAVGKPAPLEIPAEARRFEIAYSGLSFAAPERVRYRYRITEGDNEDWIEVGPTRSVSFLGLPPGRYVFEVSAMSRGGAWHPEAARLPFRVLPYWWETGWAQAGAGVLGVLVVGLVARQIIRRRLRVIEARQAMERAVARERERIAQDMHDDLGARLTQLSFQGEMAQRLVADPPRLEGGLQDLVGGVRQTAQALDDIVWMTNPRNDRLDRLVSHLAHLATEMSEMADWKLQLKLPHAVRSDEISGHVRHEIVMLVKESLNNASKYSRASRIVLELTFSEVAMTLSIEDDGVGFSVDEEAEKGNGLEQMRRRAQECEGTLSIQSEFNVGTRVTLTVPLIAFAKRH